LRRILELLPVQVNPNLIVGHNSADDAGVYRLDNNTALVLTVDFFAPVVDDPFDYGRVAAANALSDVYAMGGRPIAALNIAGFPEAELPGEVMSEVFRGGAATAEEAGVVIAGGHTISDKEVKYGLAVVGVIHPEKIVQNSSARPGDVLILTKPLGTGILTTALKLDRIDDSHYEALIQSMTRLNRTACEKMIEFDSHACTDITGYGLLGHGLEMAQASGVTLEFNAASIPTLPGVAEAIGKGHLTGGGTTNRAFIEDHAEWARPPGEIVEHELLDPQTSGGLLIAVPEDRGGPLLEALKQSEPHASLVGRVRKKGGKFLRIV
jgi:selenide,water dikinase